LLWHQGTVPEAIWKSAVVVDMNSEQVCFVVLVVTFVSALVVLGPMYVAYERAVANGALESLKGYPGFVLRLFAWVARGVDITALDASPGRRCQGRYPVGSPDPLSDSSRRAAR
jgi:hypothetical protein